MNVWLSIGSPWNNTHYKVVKIESSELSDRVFMKHVVDREINWNSCNKKKLKILHSMVYILYYKMNRNNDCKSDYFDAC